VREKRKSLSDKGLHGVKGSISERAAEPFSSVAGLIAMLLVEEGVEGGMEGLDLRLRCATEEMMALSKFQRVSEHVELRKCSLTSLTGPVVLNILHCFTPILDLLCLPLFLVEEVFVQLLLPALEG
jgi:hypothetical protein